MTILCYHAVDPAWTSPLSVPPEDFAAQCDWLARSGRVVSLERAVASGRLAAPRATAMTFDDGFASVYEHALPALARTRLPATVFVVTRTLISERPAVDWVDDPPAEPLRTLTVDQILEMRDAGVSFASHSHSHADLASLAEDECERDLRESRATLEDVLHEPVRFLAYPRGRHDARVRRAAERAGFTHAFSLPEAPEPRGRFAIPRVGVYPGNGVGSLRVKLHPAYLPVRMSPLFPLLRRVARRGPPPRRAG